MLESELTWVKASHCNHNACVQVAKVGNKRYTFRDKIGNQVYYNKEELRFFFEGVVAGDFNHLLD